MAITVKKCPKCDGELTFKVPKQEDVGCVLIYRAECKRCQIVGDAAFSMSYALTRFYCEYGWPLVSLEEIVKAGGPSVKVMRRRIKSLRYPDALMQRCEWRLPLQTAEAIIVECQVEEKK